MGIFSRSDSGQSEEPAAEVATGARLIPRITIQAFCEHSQTAQLVESAIHDRRMSKVALTTHNGGIEAASLAASSSLGGFMGNCTGVVTW